MPEGSIDPMFDYLGALRRDTGNTWPTIDAGQAQAIEVRDLLSERLSPFTSDDVDVVVFGSLARREWTTGSDVDWTMLIDGQADTQHRAAAREIESVVSGIEYRGVPLKAPGSEGIFGNMAFSHQIVHHIGGQSDTNRNTTQRVLLLLEATALRGPGEESTGAFARVVRQILNRYLLSDSNFHSQADDLSRIPRFLLNDIVRYWRTMCVDFAYKDWEQAGKKWALRNIKLRTSRKLLFVAGLLTVFSCYRNASLRREAPDNAQYLLQLQEHLLRFVLATPLNILVWTLRQLGLDDACVAFLNDYEQFLVKINDPHIREQLASLSEQQVYTDTAFLHCREISHRLQATLKRICFEIDTPLREFTFEYGVF